MGENVGCPQMRAVGPLPLLYTNEFIASLDCKARFSPTDPRNTTGLSLQSVPAAWCLQQEKSKGKSLGHGRERLDAQHSTMRKKKPHTAQFISSHICKIRFIPTTPPTVFISNSCKK